MACLDAPSAGRIAFVPRNGSPAFVPAALWRRLGAVVLAAALPWTAVARGEPSDADFLAARNAFERGDRIRLKALAPSVAGHVLEPYVAYWEHKLALDTATADEVRRYLSRWPNTPLADRLRVEWLKVLGRRGEWATFALEYPPPAGEDTELACYGIQFRRQRDGDGALSAARPLWFTGQAAPESCEPLFAALTASGALTGADRHARYRLAVEAGNVKLGQAIAAEFPADRWIAGKDFARVDADPLRALEKGDFAWKRQSGRDLALYALERAARSDAALARPAWERQRDRLTDADRRYGNARIAFHAARQLSPQANSWFAEARGVALGENERAWRARAALRAGAWGDVLAAIDAMPEGQAREAAWRYWKARALAAAGRHDEAEVSYLSFGGETNFYAVLAAEALGQPLHAAARRDAAVGLAAATPAALAEFGARPGVRRAVKLAALDMKPESLREWIYAVRGLDDDALLVAAEYAYSQKLYDRAINTAERTAEKQDFRLRYLMPYREHFSTAARQQEIDEAILFGVARQESRFSIDLVSSAGAVGLMQLMPPTARLVAKQLGRSDYQPSRIADPAINTQFGAYYFKYWLDRLDRLPALAAAAYNAGPNRAQAWRTGTPLEGAIWVETIPFNETRDYVKKVLANVMFYARELDHPFLPLSARLGTIPPRSAVPALAAQAN
jgi:soluble lytic murein transglycosylase